MWFLASIEPILPITGLSWVWKKRHIALEYCFQPEVIDADNPGIMFSKTVPPTGFSPRWSWF
jgi:hypothetical protein